MATLGATYLDLIDVYKSQDGSGNVVDVIEILAEKNPILDDAIAVECNQGTHHLHTVRTGLPTNVWGKLYQGIPASKSTRAQVTDTTGFVEALSGVDSRLLEISNNAAALRLQEADAHLESIAQTVANRMFYGNTAADPEEFMGLTPRFNDPTAPNGGQIINAGGTGSDNTSIWFVTWGENTCHTLYPKGTKAGVTRQDKGEQRVTDSNGDAYFQYEDLFRWHIGLAVKDWRYVSRICNVDVSRVDSDPTDVDGNGNSLYHFMRKAYWQHQRRRQMAGASGGRTAIYCNKDILEALDALGTNSGANDTFIRLKPEEIQGKEVLTYRSMPLRESDALLNTESLVTGF
jgi:hypothetical protein